MKKLSPYLLGLSLAVAGSSLAAAQETSSGTPSLPKVLQITREYTKPYKGGAAHDKTEGAFVQAMTKAKWPTHYFALNSLSGKLRALYLTHYDSLEAWEKDSAAVAKNSALSAELERASVADGELLDSVDQGVFLYSDELSYHARADLSHQRYMEISAYNVRPGHEKEWNELVKLVKAGYEKAGIDAHWGTFGLIYGGQGGRYIVLSAHKTLAEVDNDFLNDKLFEKALGEDGLKQLDTLVQASIESSEHNLYQFNPRQSYVSDEWIKADPEFWKPKAAAPAAKPAVEKEKAKP
jgi:hypothetical protein